MSSSAPQSSNSHFIELIAISSCFIQCCMLLFNGPNQADPEAASAAFHMALVMQLFSLTSIVLNSIYRGTRIHLYPLMMGFVAYSLAFFFQYMEEMAFYYYYLMVLVTMVITWFFGSTNYYNSFQLSGRNPNIGAVISQMKIGGNRVTIYYPAKKNDKNFYSDYKWAHDGEHTLKGMMKFGADILPQGPFNHLQSVRQNVKVKAPLQRAEGKDGGQDTEKFVPIIFSPGIGNSMSWFSTLFKDLASQGFIVYSLEHNDRSALHYFDENQGKHQYFKHIDMRDQNQIKVKLGIRLKELDQLVNEIQALTNSTLGSDQSPITLDMDNLTIMGHGFGATSAIVMASKDRRIKKVITFDPWIAPFKDEVMEKSIMITQPHASINSELFHNNVPQNWQLLNQLFAPAKRHRDSPDEGSILCMINNIGHMAFSDLSLILLLELRLIQFTPSFAQVFRGQYNMKLIIDVMRAFFLRNHMSKETGKYEDLIARLEKTQDLVFEMK